MIKESDITSDMIEKVMNYLTLKIARDLCDKKNKKNELEVLEKHEFHVQPKYAVAKYKHNIRMRDRCSTCMLSEKDSLRFDELLYRLNKANNVDLGSPSIIITSHLYVKMMRAEGDVLNIVKSKYGISPVTIFNGEQENEMLKLFLNAVIISNKNKFENIDYKSVLKTLTKN